MLQSVTVAAVQASAETCWSESHFREKILDLTKRSKAAGATILVFPEDLGIWLQFCRHGAAVDALRDALSGKVVSAAGFAARGWFERVTDAFFNHVKLNFVGDWLSSNRIARIVDRVFSEAARTHGVTIVAGSIFLRRADGFRDISFVYNPDGSQAGIYEKVNLIATEKSLGMTGAPAPVVIHTHDYILGVCICYDLNSPELVRSLSDQGAQIILTPTMGIRPWPNYPYDLIHDEPQIERAKETGLAVVRAYMCGLMFPGLWFDGHASITAPDGSVPARSKSARHEEIVVATVPLRSKKV